VPDGIAQFRNLGAAPVQRTAEQSLERHVAEIAKMKDIVARAKIPPAD
jgi:hypothetical protein